MQGYNFVKGSLGYLMAALSNPLLGCCCCFFIIITRAFCSGLKLTFWKIPSCQSRVYTMYLQPACILIITKMGYSVFGNPQLI